MLNTENEKLSKKIKCVGAFICNNEAKYYVHLTTRVIPRCEKHKLEFISNILKIEKIRKVKQN